MAGSASIFPTGPAGPYASPAPAAPDPSAYSPYAPSLLQTPDLNSFDPNNDPIFRNYMDRLGLTKEQQSRQIARQQQYLNDSLNAQRPVWAEQRADALAGIRDSSSSRGTLGGSQQKFQNNKANTAVDRTIANAERQNNYQQANLSDSLRNGIADSRIAREGAGIEARQRQANASLQNSIYQNDYQQALGAYNQGMSSLNSYGQ